MVKYVWNPANPITDHIEKKHINVTRTLNGAFFTISVNCSSPSLPTARARMQNGTKFKTVETFGLKSHFKWLSFECGAERMQVFDVPASLYTYTVLNA